jgi:pyridoxal phosphate enzyme (YggS family)
LREEHQPCHASRRRERARLGARSRSGVDLDAREAEESRHSVAHPRTSLSAKRPCRPAPDPRKGHVTSVAENLGAIREKIARAAERSGRTADAVRLIAVSKGHDVAAIREAIAAGQRVFGENYVQELIAKAHALETETAPIELHMIGGLQRNKVKDVVGIVKAIHTVDRAALAIEIDKRAAAPIDVLIEVNIGKEAQKSGCDPDHAEALAGELARLPKLRLVGWMAIPPVGEASEVRASFERLRALRDRHRSAFPTAIELSMGMSDSFEDAILEGATMVRVGTAIFGARPPRSGA